jgi:cephalosporin hydroxylase
MNNGMIEGNDVGHISFFGLPMQQNLNAPAKISSFLNEIKPVRIIEIGTGMGGLSVLLKMYGAEFVTYDTNDTRIFDHGIFGALGIDYRRWDCFKRKDEIADMIGRKGTTLVMCDGGNKHKEFTTFATYLKSGDYICAHDYSNDPNIWRWSEIDDDVITPDLEKLHNLDGAAWLCCRKI